MTATSLRSLHGQLKGSTDVQQMSKGDGFSVAPELILEQKDFNTRGAFMEPGEYFEQGHIKAHIRKLADAYKRGDYVPPLVVKVIDGKIYVRDGHCRRRALNLAISEGAEIKMVQVVEQRGDEAAQTLLVVTSNDGQPLTVLERAVILGRLESYGWAKNQIAEAVGLTVSHVTNMLKMLDMPIAIKQAVQRDQISATHALELFNKHGSQAVEIIAAEIEKQTEAASQTGEKKVKVTKSTTATGPKPWNRKITTAVQSSFTELSKRLDTITPRDDGKFNLVITADDLDLLNKIKAQMAEESNGEKNDKQLELQ